MNSKRKGKRGELELARKLREYGYDCRRGQQYSGIGGDDVVGLPHIHIECKRRRTSLKMSSRESICWDCANARAHLCPWIGEKKKIWTKAIESTFRANSVRNRKITIYKVTNCPNYVREAMRA